MQFMTYLDQGKIGFRVLLSPIHMNSMAKFQSFVFEFYRKKTFGGIIIVTLFEPLTKPQKIKIELHILPQSAAY